MTRIVAVSCAILLLTGSARLQGQVPARQPAPPPPAGSGEVRGKVLDAGTKQPLPTASIAVWSSSDSAVAAGAIAGKDGTFRVDGLRPGRYYLKVSSLGYGTHTSLELVVAETALRVLAGSIELVRAPIKLEGLDVATERGVVIAPDRNSYRARDVAPAATTASDVLESVPSVQVDADGKVSLRGNENVVVQINGRPSPIRGAQLAGYLRQLPANTIERVEVIPNPTAKQDPEGMAGILNIVLKQTVDLGRSGGFTIGASTADRYNVSANFGYQGGPITLFTTYGYTSDERQVAGVNDRTRLGAERSPLFYTEQDIDGTALNHGHNFNASLDYRLSPRDVVYTSMMLNRRSLSDESLAGYHELDQNRALVDRYLRTRDVATSSWLADGTLGYRRVMTPQQHELSAEVRFSRTDDEDRNRLWRERLDAVGRPDGAAFDRESNAFDALTRQLIAQVDYTRMLGQRTKLETGYKRTARWLDRDYQALRDPLGSGEWQVSDLSNAIEFDEQVNAVYGVVSHNRGALELQAGLRAEQAHRDFSLRGGDDYPHDYTSLFPSGLVSYRLNDRTQAKLSYSRRIRRPGTGELNPFPQFMDVQNAMIGNPELDPEYTDAIELGLQRSGQYGSLQLAPFYRHTSDIIRIAVNTADTVAGREVTTVSFENLATGTSWGADLNGQLTLGKKLNALAGVNVFKMVTDGGSLSSLSSDALSWMARVNGTYNLDPLTALQAAYFYRAPTDFERGRFFGMSMLNVSVRRKIYDERGTVTLRWADPFRTAGFRVEAGDDNLIQQTSSRFNSRAVYLTFQYSLGQAPRVRQRPQDEEQAGQTGFPIR